MKLRTLAVVIALLGIAAGVLLWQDGKGSGRAQEPGRAHPLEAAELARARSIELSSGPSGESVRLEQTGDGRWIVPGYHGLPVDFPKLSRLMTDLLESRVAREVTRNPDRVERLEIGRTLIRLFDSPGELIWEMRIGSPAQSGGIHLMIAGDPAVWQLERGLWVDTRVDQWVDRQVLRWQPEEVVAVEVEVGAGIRLSFARGGLSDPWILASPARSGSVRQDRLDRLVGTLLNARFVALAMDPSSPEVTGARENARTVVLRHRDGRVVSVSLGRRPAAMTEEGNAAEEAGSRGPVYGFFQFGEGDGKATTGFAEGAFQFSDYVYTQLPEEESDLFLTTTEAELVLPLGEMLREAIHADTDLDSGSAPDGKAPGSDSAEAGSGS